MKNIILTFLLVGATMVSIAKERKNISIDNLKVERSGDNLNLSFKALCNGSYDKHSYKMFLTPVLFNGSDAQNLKPIIIETRRSKIVDFRNRTEIPIGSFAVRKGDEVLYNITIPYKEWMDGSSLRIDRMVSGCCNEKPLAPIIIADNFKFKKEVHIFQPHYSYIVPDAEQVKKRSEIGKAYLEFAVGRATLIDDFKLNQTELTKIGTTIDMIRQDENLVLRNIALRGTCSPEGRWNTNMVLAERRTAALQQYIETRYGYSKSIFSLSSLAEDWSGLASLVERSAVMPQREELLQIINSDIDPDTKDRQIAMLNDGATYRYLLEDIYPKLRRVDYTINYDIKGFDLAQSKEVFSTHPQYLSLNELYLIADSYPVNSPEFRNLFVTAARLYPGDATAAINAATNALENGDIIGAEFYLNSVKNSSIPQYENTKGILMMLRGDHTIAEILFKSAAANGLMAATANLEELNKSIAK